MLTLEQITDGLREIAAGLEPALYDGRDAARLTGVAAEAKTGFAKLSPFVQRQIDKDVKLLQQGRVTSLEWHFYPSSASGTVGPSRELLDELTAKGIDYVIHLP